MNSPTRAAVPAPPAQSPPTPAVAAARAWPRFHARRQQQGDGRPDLVIFPCPACGLNEILDVETGLCRFCWRCWAFVQAPLAEAQP